MRVAIKFAYDGRKFYGFARQPGLKTVEEDIINMLLKNSFIRDPKQSHFRYASRTDKGVSALGNVAAFNIELKIDDILQKLNDDLVDIFVYGTTKVDDDFYPRHAKQRAYRYYLKKNIIEVDKLLSIISIFTGEHNFSNFARVEEFKDPCRIIDNIVVSEQDDFFVIDFYAQTFLWHQIRRVISTVEKVGKNTLKLDQVRDALKKPDEKVDFGLASAQPLILKDIVYDFDFNYDKDYLKRLNDLENNLKDSISS